MGTPNTHRALTANGKVVDVHESGAGGGSQFVYALGHRVYGDVIYAPRTWSDEAQAYLPSFVAKGKWAFIFALGIAAVQPEGASV